MSLIVSLLPTIAQDSAEQALPSFPSFIYNLNMFTILYLSQLIITIMTSPTLPHNHTVDHCKCLNCRNTLIVKGPAASGIAPGHLYIHVSHSLCTLGSWIIANSNFKCNRCGYHYIFPKWCQCNTHRSPTLAISAGSSSHKHVVRHSSCASE